MRFRIKKTDVHISFSFWAVILIFVISKNYPIYKYLFISSLVHECVHLLFIVLFGETVSKITFSFLGCEIKRGNMVALKIYKEAIISLSAPIFNIFVGCILLTVSDGKSILGLINITIGAFNILPFYNFDGGRGLYYIIASEVSEKSAQMILFVTSVFVTVIFAFFSVHIFFNYTKNYVMLIMCLYMFISIIFNVLRLKPRTDLCNNY